MPWWWFFFFYETSPFKVSESFQEFTVICYFIELFLTTVLRVDNNLSSIILATLLQELYKASCSCSHFRDTEFVLRDSIYAGHPWGLPKGQAAISLKQWNEMCAYKEKKSKKRKHSEKSFHLECTFLLPSQHKL